MIDIMHRQKKLTGIFTLSIILRSQNCLCGFEKEYYLANLLPGKQMRMTKTLHAICDFLIAA